MLFVVGLRKVPVAFGSVITEGSGPGLHCPSHPLQCLWHFLESRLYKTQLQRPRKLINRTTKHEFGAFWLLSDSEESIIDLLRNLFSVWSSLNFPNADVCEIIQCSECDRILFFIRPNFTLQQQTRLFPLLLFWNSQAIHVFMETFEHKYKSGQFPTVTASGSSCCVAASQDGRNQAVPLCLLTSEAKWNGCLINGYDKGFGLISIFDKNCLHGLQSSQIWHLC